MLETGASAQSEGIHEVLHSLDAATKEFARRLDALGAAGAPQTGADPPHAGAGRPSPVVDVAAAAPPDVEPYPSLGIGRTNLDLERRMADAEAEAQGYLEEAKRRADSMVQSIVNAVEAEADAMRRDAEDAIRKRWVEVEAEADRFLAEARRAADGIVENRQRRIADLSDAIVGLAGELTERMSDAARMRRQFDSLVEGLSDAAERIAEDPASGGAVAERPRGSWRARVEAAEAAEAQVL